MPHIRSYYARVVLLIAFVSLSFYLFLGSTSLNIFRRKLGSNDGTESQLRLEVLELQKRLNEGEKQKRINAWKTVEEMLKKQRKKKRLPSIIGIGVEKCGTHALAQFLWPHPLIRNRVPIEAHFFEGRNFKDISTYLLSMPEVEENALTMEKTPAYFSFPPLDVPRLIKTSVPDAKLLLILCDPTKRVISDYAQELIMGSITKEKFPTVESYLRSYMPRLSKFRIFSNSTKQLLRENLIKYHQHDYPSTILTTGFYALHLSRWLEYYNSSNLFIVNGDEMMEHPGRVVERIQDFLDIPKLLLEEDYVRDPQTGFFCFKHPLSGELSCMIPAKMRTRNGKANYSEETMNQLRAFYKLPNEHLYEMLNERFDW